MLFSVRDSDASKAVVFPGTSFCVELERGSSPISWSCVFEEAEDDAATLSDDFNATSASTCTELVSFSSSLAFSEIFSGIFSEFSSCCLFDDCCSMFVSFAAVTLLLLRVVSSKLLSK